MAGGKQNLFSTTIRAQMWTPDDITALPTQRDLTLANHAIKGTEEELKIALIALAGAQRRVADLEKDLAWRRAWIAPIRRLSLDAISLIFEFCGEDDWRTPLPISEVSRQWRNLVLATPRAWAFLELNDFDDENHIFDLFFQRSAHFISFFSRYHVHPVLVEYGNKVEMPLHTGRGRVSGRRRLSSPGPSDNPR